MFAPFVCVCNLNKKSTSEVLRFAHIKVSERLRSIDGGRLLGRTVNVKVGDAVERG